jgi:hypothetical protein
VKSARNWLGTSAIAVAILATPSGCSAQSRSKYPDMDGQWVRIDPIGVFDPSKPSGSAQDPPLTPEYRAIYETGLKDQAAGGPGTDPTYSCISVGMPRAMNAVFPLEIVVKEKMTYMFLDYQQVRRIYTDNRAFPDGADGTFMGYSIGRWIDTDHDGAYDELQVETRLLKSPRSFDPSGIPLHADGETIVEERLWLDPLNAEVLHDEITTIDHALTRPWIVTKSYRHEHHPIFTEAICEDQTVRFVRIGEDVYVINAQGYLTPYKKGQVPPDLKHFEGP